MPLCGCATTTLTVLTFERGLTLMRCGVHDEQTWAVDGEPIALDDAHARLRLAFAESRPQTRRTGSRACGGRILKGLVQRPPAWQPRPAAVDVRSMPGADERLTALLRAHGLHGSWSVA